MAQGRRRHVKTPALALRSVFAWGVVCLGATLGLLVAFGAGWVRAILGTAGLLVILLLAYALERTGLMRLSNLEEASEDPTPRRPPEPPAR